MSGEKSMWTPANVVTCVRVVLVPLWLLLAELVGVDFTRADSMSWPAVAVFVAYVVISLTDKLDGWLARSRNEVTTFGKFLDPIADKLAVVVALSFLLEHSMVSSWVLLVVIAREFLVSGLRMVVASRGVVIAASNLGKWKTATTMTSICGLLLVAALPQASAAAWVLSRVSYALLAAAVILTAWSGIDYFAKSWKYLTEVD